MKSNLKAHRHTKRVVNTEKHVKITYLFTWQTCKYWGLWWPCSCPAHFRHTNTPSMHLATLPCTAITIVHTFKAYCQHISICTYKNTNIDHYLHVPSLPRLRRSPIHIKRYSHTPTTHRGTAIVDLSKHTGTQNALYKLVNNEKHKKPSRCYIRIMRIAALIFNSIFILLLLVAKKT